MSRKRKPIAKSMETATESVVWRARILCELLDGAGTATGNAQVQGATKRLQEALDDFEFNRSYVNGAAKPSQLELQP